MNRLNDKIKALMIEAIKTTGSYAPNDTLFLFEERLTLKESEVVEKFLTWVAADEENRCFGTGNIDAVFTRFKQETIDK